MKTENLRIGNLGENIAREYLKSKGYRIIENNHRNKYAEIDLIARDKQKILIFIEVRTKTSEQLVSPEESINKRKICRLVRNAKAYLGKINYKTLARIDAVCIVLSEEETCRRITHYENISQDFKS